MFHSSEDEGNRTGTSYTQCPTQARPVLNFIKERTLYSTGDTGDRYSASLKKNQSSSNCSVFCKWRPTAQARFLLSVIDKVEVVSKALKLGFSKPGLINIAYVFRDGFSSKPRA